MKQVEKYLQIHLGIIVIRRELNNEIANEGN